MTPELAQQFEALSKLGSQVSANLVVNDMLTWANKYAGILTPQARAELIAIAGKYVDL